MYGCVDANKVFTFCKYSVRFVNSFHVLLCVCIFLRFDGYLYKTFVFYTNCNSTVKCNFCKLNDTFRKQSLRFVILTHRNYKNYLTKRK